MNPTSTLSLSDREHGVVSHDATADREDCKACVAAKEVEPDWPGVDGHLRRRKIGRLLTLVALATYFAGVAVLLRDLGSRCLSWLPSLYRLFGCR
jgi:hypothetical protein